MSTTIISCSILSEIERSVQQDMQGAAASGLNHSDRSDIIVKIKARLAGSKSFRSHSTLAKTKGKRKKQIQSPVLVLCITSDASVAPYLIFLSTFVF